MIAHLIEIQESRVYILYMTILSQVAKLNAWASSDMGVATIVRGEKSFCNAPILPIFLLVVWLCYYSIICNDIDA